MARLSMLVGGLSIWLLYELVLGLVTLIVSLSLISLYKKYRTVKRLVAQDSVLLELTPPPSPHNTLLATEEFFTVLRQVVSIRTWRDMLTGRKTAIALEVVSSHEQGIRYLVRVPRKDQQVFLHTLSALAPTVTAEESSDYAAVVSPISLNRCRVLNLKQTGPRLHSLRLNTKEGATDPIAYLTNAMSQLEPGEFIALQIVLTPAPDWFIYTPHGPNADTAPEGLVPASLLKAREPLFHALLRIVVSTEPEHAEERVKGITSSLSAYAYEGFQSLQPRFEAKGFYRRVQLFGFRYRLPNLTNRTACVLAAGELAALYHFPYGTTSRTEHLKTGKETNLPLPLSVRNRLDPDLIVGENSYRGRSVPIGLTRADRERHVYVVGGTGNGKTTLLAGAIVQDMQKGKGVAVIDPHGDLAEKVLSYVPPERLEDVIYLNPSDLSYPIGLNLLQLPPDLKGDELLQEKDLVTESIVSMFRKIFSTNDTSGHRIEYVLRNAVQTALTIEGATLFTVYDLLNDPAYRRRVVGKLDNPDLRLFWREFSRAGSFQQVSMAAGITAKIGRFLFSAAARRMLEQPTSSLQFDTILDEGKILICNVSKGRLGEDTSELFGIMVLTKLQLAALRRARKSSEERRPFYVYVDEFQNFATPSFVQLLSEARKYGLFLTMAEQSTAQQTDSRMMDIVFANVGTVIAFRTSSPRDEQLLLPLFAPHVETGTLGRLPAYSFFMRLASKQTEPPFSGHTVLLAPPVDPAVAALAVHASRLQYAGTLDGVVSQTAELEVPTSAGQALEPDTGFSYYTALNGVR